MPKHVRCRVALLRAYAPVVFVLWRDLSPVVWMPQALRFHVEHAWYVSSDKALCSHQHEVEKHVFPVTPGCWALRYGHPADSVIDIVSNVRLCTAIRGTRDGCGAEGSHSRDLNLFTFTGTPRQCLASDRRCSFLETRVRVQCEERAIARAEVRSQARLHRAEDESGQI